MLRLSLCSVTVVASLLVTFLSSAASAEQRMINTPEGEKVVHTRLAPVVAHRIVPPYFGKHVYQGRRR